MRKLAHRRGEDYIIDGRGFARLAAIALVAFASSAGAQGLEDLLEDAIDEQVESEIEVQIEAEIEAEIASAVQSAIERQVDSTVAESVELGLEVQVDEAIGVGIDADLGIDGLSDALRDLIGSLTAESQGAARFAEGIDPGNRAVEADVWVVLVPVQYADRIETWGFELLERRDLEALDRVLLRVEAPEDRDIVQAALDLALDAPGTVVDYNHVYEPTMDDIVAGEPAGQPARRAPRDGSIEAPFSIGIVDSIVDPSHPALERVDIEQRDFVPFGNERTAGHGTAVASIIVDAVGTSTEPARLDKLRAASVFFRDDDGKVRATTAGLIAAVDWLAGTPDLGVINMSLAGPPNELLEVALGDLARRGIAMVAAVGNSGPTAAPLYPAAYDGVVGVTAVDSSHRIYRHANRGRQVMFSALGVQVKVASPSGGFSTQSGTSLAAPWVAALIAESMAAEARSFADALEGLRATAVDLGERDYDEIFGYGLARRTP
jgi:subtilisin family serine protease